MTARRALATAAILLVLGYVAVDVVLQLLPPHYSVISEAESNLAVGPYGWAMNLNFLGRGLMSVCLAAAITLVGPTSRLRTTGVALLVAGGVCSAALALFVTDIGLATTATGYAHLAIASAGFVIALAAITLLTGWARTAGLPYRRATGAALALAWIGLIALGVAVAAAPQVLGLVERLCLLGILGWALVVALGVRARPGVERA